MKRTLLAALIAATYLGVLGSAPASAADMAVKARPAPPPVYDDWSGFYIGGHGGYGWGHTRDIDPRNLETDFIPRQRFGEPRLRGPVAGFHAGYNQQWGSIVGGLEIDLDWANIKEDQDISFTAQGITIREGLDAKIDALGTVRARLGFLATPHFLIYGTGGLAWGHSQIDRNATINIVGQPTINVDLTGSTNLFGWVAGVGGEYMLTKNFLVRLEYLHYDFQKTTHSLGGFITQGALFVNLPSVNADARLSVDVVRAGLTYKFDSPVFAARY